MVIIGKVGRGRKCLSRSVRGIVLRSPDGTRPSLATCLPLRPQWLPAGLDGQAAVTPVLTRMSGPERAGRRLRTGGIPSESQREVFSATWDL